MIICLAASLINPAAHFLLLCADPARGTPDEQGAHREGPRGHEEHLRLGEALPGKHVRAAEDPPQAELRPGPGVHHRPRGQRGPVRP